MLTRVLNLELTLNFGLSLGHVLNTWGGGNGYLQLKEVSKIALLKIVSSPLPN